MDVPTLDADPQAALFHLKFRDFPLDQDIDKTLDLLEIPALFGAFSSAGWIFAAHVACSVEPITEPWAAGQETCPIKARGLTLTE
jgi:hypothetical protein